MITIESVWILYMPENKKIQKRVLVPPKTFVEHDWWFCKWTFLSILMIIYYYTLCQGVKNIFIFIVFLTIFVIEY